MVNLVEQATLKVVDESSATLKKIDQALKNLQKTAAAFGSKKLDLSASVKGLDKADASIKKLVGDLAKLRSPPPLHVSADTSAASAAVRKLHQQAISPATMPVHAAEPPAPSRRGGYVGTMGIHEPAPAPRSRASRYAGAAISGAAQGFGLPIMGLSGGFAAVETAAYLAAKALAAIAESAQTRDRTTLQSAVAATEAQRKKFAELDRLAAAGPPKAFPMTQDQRNRLRTSLLGDVGGETEEERATAAESITKFLEEKLYPRFFAQDPTKTPEQAQEGMRKIVQAVNLATADLTDKFGNMTADGERVFKGIQLALAADPEIPPTLIKSTIANMKTAGFALSDQQIATTLMAASNQGVRAGNEVFRAIKALSGTTDVKALNNNLAKLGLLTDVQRNAKGNVKAGSGTAVDQRLLQTDPMEYLHKYVAPIMEEQLKTQAQKRATKIKGTTPEAEGKRVEAGQVTQDDRIAWINRNFAGMNAAAQNGIAQMLLGYEQNGRQLRQAQAGLTQDANAAIKKSWSAQWETLKVALEDKKAEIGDAAFKAIGLADKLDYVTKAIRDPTGKEGQTLAAGYATAILKATAGGALVTGAQLLISGSQMLQSAAGAVGKYFGAPEKTPEQSAKDTALTQNQGEQTSIRQQIIALQAQLDAARRTAATTPSLPEKTAANAQTADLIARIASLEEALRAKQAQEERLSERGTAEPTLKDFPRWVQNAVPGLKMPPAKPPKPLVKTAWEDTEVAHRANEKAERDARKKAVKQQVVPKSERNAWGPTTPSPYADIKAAVEQFNSAAGTFGSQLEGGASRIDSAASTFGSQLEGGASRIEQAFGAFGPAMDAGSATLNTAATNVGNSGSIAASFLQSAAPGIGAAIGSAAAAQIAAATAAITINVNRNDTPNTGGNKANPSP